MLTNEYVAGLFDGEGCFCIYQASTGKKLRPQVGYFTAQAVVEIRQKEIPELLKEKYGGIISLNQGRQENHADTWVWTLRNKLLLLEFVTQVRPHLIIKSKQADVIAEFLSIRLLKKTSPVTADEFEKQQQLKFELSKLNTRGKV